MRQRDRIEILFEDMNGKFDTVMEGFEGIHVHLGRIDGRLDGIDGRLDGIDGRLDGLDGRLGRVEHQLGEVKQELHQVATVVLEHDSWISSQSS